MPQSHCVLFVTRLWKKVIICNIRCVENKYWDTKWFFKNVLPLQLRALLHTFDAQMFVSHAHITYWICSLDIKSGKFTPVCSIHIIGTHSFWFCKSDWPWCLFIRDVYVVAQIINCDKTRLHCVIKLITVLILDGTSVDTE